MAPSGKVGRDEVLAFVRGEGADIAWRLPCRMDDVRIFGGIPNTNFQKDKYFIFGEQRDVGSRRGRGK